MYTLINSPGNNEFLHGVHLLLQVIVSPSRLPQQLSLSLHLCHQLVVGLFEVLALPTPLLLKESVPLSNPHMICLHPQQLLLEGYQLQTQQGRGKQRKNCQAKLKDACVMFLKFIYVFIIYYPFRQLTLMIQASGHLPFLNSSTSGSDQPLADINSDLLVANEPQAD